MLVRRFPSLPSWSAGFREMDTMRREMERLFGSLGEVAGVRSSGVYPAINVSQDADAVHVRAELPGIDKDDLEITIENATLTIAGKRERSRDEEGVSYHRREREWGAFRRSVSLPVPIDGDAVEARYTDGVLTVTLPKAAEARPKQITVAAGV